MASESLDLLVFGQRLRFIRRQAGMTLEALGQAVGRPTSYLSQLENGHREPRLSTVNVLSAAPGCRPADLLAPTAPSRRAELEVALAHMQDDPRYQSLQLPYLRPSARLDDVAMEHLVALFEQVRQLDRARGLSSPAATGRAGIPVGCRTGRIPDGRHPSGPSGEPRLPPARLRGDRRPGRQRGHEKRMRSGTTISRRSSRPPVRLSPRWINGARAGVGANLTDVAAYFGFTIARVQDLPPSTRSISDLRHRVVYVPQRNATGGMRSARSVIAQTLGHFALGHKDPTDFEGYVRQRVEANYFAGALLSPEKAVVRVLADAKTREDISVEDLTEMFYISYEMAAHRLTNLITRHFEIPIHFQRSDPDGILWKAYENDGVLLPSDIDGTIEGQSLCRWWSSRQAYESSDSYALHYQYTETVAGTFWCATHIDLDRARGDAITVGTVEPSAHWFRGSDTLRRAESTCPDPLCCRRPSDEAVRRWEGVAWPSARDRSHFVSGLPTDTVVFSPHPGVALTDVYSFLDRHSGSPVAP